jgi:hypothetical protein
MAEFNTVTKEFRQDSGGSNSVLSAGDIEIVELAIISAVGTVFDIRLYLAELNLYEDMFRSALYGNILVIDALNLADVVPLRGEEFLRIRLRTPTMTSEIFKTFRIYSTTDRRFLGEPNKQSFVLHFCSAEMYIDMLSPLWKSFKGRVSDVVADIYKNHLQTSRNGLKDDDTPLIILDETKNNIKYVSPGWTPAQNINWLATRSLSNSVQSPAYLFFESNKAFYFANIEAIINQSVQDKSIYNQYVYMAHQISADSAKEDLVRDVDKDYKRIESLEVIENLNYVKATQAGYFANRLYTVDMLRKDYAIYDYDHVSNYNVYSHLDNIGFLPNDRIMPMAAGTARNPAAATAFYPKHLGLHDDQDVNISEVIQEIIPRRRSLLNEMENLKLQITVPGRTDAEIGSIIYLSYPMARPRNSEDYALGNEDPIFSGFYLVTAIRHKITLIKHTMTMEIVKDSVQRPMGLYRE